VLMPKDMPLEQLLAPDAAPVSPNQQDEADEPKKAWWKLW